MQPHSSQRRSFVSEHGAALIIGGAILIAAAVVVGAKFMLRNGNGSTRLASEAAESSFIGCPVW